MDDASGASHEGQGVLDESGDVCGAADEVDPQLAFTWLGAWGEDDGDCVAVHDVQVGVCVEHVAWVRVAGREGGGAL